MKKSDSILNLAPALMKAQAKLKPILFDAKNPFLKNSYVTLGAVIEATKAILLEFGFTVIQLPVSKMDTGTYTVGVDTMLLHESGEFLEEECFLPIEHQKGTSLGQQGGINISYIRRYALLALLNLYGDADVDAENRAANELVTKIMADEKTGEIPMERTWSFEQMDAMLELSVGIAGDYEEAKVILDTSVLPESATPKAVASWFKHYKKAYDEKKESMPATMAANTAYLDALKGKKNGGK